MNRKLKKKCEKIAQEAGARLTWIEGQHGFYIPGTNKIFVGNTGSDQDTISIFCHELGHYKNYLNRKYYKYHHLKGKAFMRRFKTKDAVVRYALKAELYTDKVGRRLCKKLFPGVTFKAGYKNNRKFYNMLYQKYFGFFIIVVERFNKKNLTKS